MKISENNLILNCKSGKVTAEDHFNTEMNCSHEKRSKVRNRETHREERKKWFNSKQLI